MTDDLQHVWRRDALYSDDDLVRHAYVRLEDVRGTELVATSKRDGARLEFERVEDGVWLLVERGGIRPTT